MLTANRCTRNRATVAAVYDRRSPIRWQRHFRWKIYRWLKTSALIERRYRTSLRMRFIEPVLVPVFKREIPI